MLRPIYSIIEDPKKTKTKDQTSSANMSETYIGFSENGCIETFGCFVIIARQMKQYTKTYLNKIRKDKILFEEFFEYSLYLKIRINITWII
jgi:hypothetical protein